MMLILGLGSQFGFIQMISSSIIDNWPHLRAHQWRVTAGISLSCFVAALPMTCNGGIYLQTLIEWHTASWNLFLIGIAQIVILAWIYGMSRALDNIKEMGMKLMKVTRLYWTSVWVVLTPLLLAAVFVFMLTDLAPTEFRGYEFPVWADIMGYMFGLATLTPFIIFASIHLVNVARGKQNFKQLFRPTPQWGAQLVDGKRVDRSRLE